MPAVQTQFDEFHDAIKLDEDDEKATLREKRETLVKALRENLPADVPLFTKFDQGSYSMSTGVVPLDGNYDIDVGLVFDCTREKYPDPVALKKKVHTALNIPPRTVVIRRPCVTVNYMRGDIPIYHVDLAIYAGRSDGLLDIAKGKENSTAAHRTWEPSDPKGLTKLICEAFTDARDLAQYRRCVRYIKRWRDVQFRNGGAPLSIALTVAARAWFKPRFEASGKSSDLLALQNWVKALLNNFSWMTTDEGFHQRLKVNLPVTPFSDLMAGMTRLQMENFKGKLESLCDALGKAYDEGVPEEACKCLQKQFGDDFPVPPKAATAKTVVAPVISTGNSA